MRLIAAITAISLATCVYAQAPDGFLTKWPDAMRAAKKDHKPIFVVFTKEDSDACAKLAKVTLCDEDVRKLLTGYVCATLDCTQSAKGPVSADIKVNRALFDRLNLQRYPAVAMVTHDGVTLEIVEGAVGPASMLRAFAAAKAINGEYLEFLKYAQKADHESYEFNLKAAVFYQKVQHAENAIRHAKKILSLDPDNEKGDHALAKLILLQFSTDPADDTYSLMEDVLKLDPRNAKSATKRHCFSRCIESIATPTIPTPPPPTRPRTSERSSSLPSWPPARTLP